MKNMYKNIIAILMIISTIITTAMPVAADVNDIVYATGLKWDDVETIEAHLTEELTLQAIPTKVDLTANFPTPGNQGNQNSCVAWAIAYALKSSQENVKRGWTKNTSAHNFSPSFVFNQLTHKGSGLVISEVMNFMVKSGVCPLNYCEYNWRDYSTKPSSEAIGAASLYKSSHYNTIKGITAIKNHLAGGDGVVIGVEVYPDFNNISSRNPIYDSIEGDSIGGHAICLIGYDDSKGAFKFINSWGTGWGLGGYGWISYDLVKSTSVNRHGAAAGFVMGPATDNYYIGDVNENGNIGSDDALLVLKYASKLISYTGRQYALGDVNGDASADAADADLILKYSANLITKFPIYE